ncbi:hypothetical protein Trco_004522 [Trichoderma cornu-damae]|uniref:Uncharacterized protein n=1 Tax=Trichoderma cornu-damae TaxID=654480 RepID=A0A9P8TX06_9HYPO|nr:hypothetical protein Trco_004522 [Trichoderma cornu-damae]
MPGTGTGDGGGDGANSLAATQSNTPIAPSGDELDPVGRVEKAMGDLLDQVHDQTSFPVDTKADKPSATLKYSVGAHLTLDIAASWVLFEGFELTNIRLGLAVSKTTHSDAAFMISLEAEAKLGDVRIKVTGTIPRLEDGRDVDFVITLTALASLDHMPLDSLVAMSSSDTIPFDSAYWLVKGAIDPSIAEQIFWDRDGGLAATASLTVTRLAAKPYKYQVKSFQAGILGSFDWDMMEDRLKLRRASLSVIARRKTPKDDLDWALEIAGSLLVSRDIPVDLSGKFVIQGGKCVGMSARIEVGSLRGVALPALMDSVAGGGSSGKAREDYEPPPNLHVPIDGLSRPLVLAVTLANKLPSGGWSLVDAEATLAMDKIGWTVIDGVTLESLMFSLEAKQDVQPAASGAPVTNSSGLAVTADPGELTYVYRAYLRGVLTLVGLPLAAEVTYLSRGNSLTIRASVPEDTICSARSLLSSVSTRVAPGQGGDPNPKYDLMPVANEEKVPQGCPLDTSWALRGDFVAHRECILRVEDSKLSSASVAVAYRGDAFSWQLSEGFRILDAGLFFEADFTAPASTTDPRISAFVYGAVALSRTTSLFGFAACSKTPGRKEFDVLLTLDVRPGASLGKPPQDIMNDKSLVGRDIDTSGWTLPSSLPEGSSLKSVAESSRATLTASLASPSPTASTVLKAVTASLRVSGSWKLLSGVELTDVALGLVARRREATPTAPFDLLASAYGKIQVQLGSSSFDLWSHALLEKQGSSSDFVATITACTAGTSKEPPVVSQLSPLQLASVPFLGNFAPEIPVDRQPPPDCPARIKDLLESTLASCEIHVTEGESAAGWNLSDITFRLAAAGLWEVLPSRVVVHAASLKVSVHEPRDSAKRSFAVDLEAQMKIGASTILDASMAFSRLQDRSIISGSLTTGSAQTVDVAKMAQELVPGQPDGTIPAGSTNFDLVTETGIRFWLDSARPTLLLVGSTMSGRLLYFLHRPNPNTQDYAWLLSMTITNTTQVFPWIDSSVTGAFKLDEIGIEVINRELQVQELVSYLTLAASSDDASIQQQVVSPVNLLRGLDPSVPLEAGAWIVASVNLGEKAGEMTDALTLAASPGSPARITMYANVKANAKAMDCHLRLSNFKLLGDSLMLNGTVTYRPSQSSIEFEATPLILLDLSSHSTPQIMAKGLMTKELTRFGAKLAEAEKVTVDDPFDLMYNTSLSIVEVTATFLKATESGKPPSSTVTMSGSLRLGSAASDWRVKAAVVFIDGKARIVTGTLETATKTDAIADRLLAPETPSPGEDSLWPSDFPVFQLDSAMVYYAKSIWSGEEPLIVDGKTYQFGYCISASIKLFGAPFTVTARLPEDRSGLQISGAYNDKIDLIFAQLHGYDYQGQKLPWPSVKIDTTNKKRVYAAETGIEFFGIQGYEISLSYESAASRDGRLRGTIAYKGSLLGISNPSISIAYEDGYLYIYSWPMLKSGEESDKDYLQNAIREASKTYKCDKCKDLVKLVLDKAIETNFDFSLGRSKTKQNPVEDKTKYVGCVEWGYEVWVNHPIRGRTRIGRLEMTPVDITISDGFNTNSIGKALLGFIIQQAPNVGKALLADAVKFPLLVGLMNMKGVAAELLSSLLCRDVKEDNVKDEAEKQINDNKEEPTKRGNATEAAFEEVGAALSFGAALAAFAGGVVAFGLFTGLEVLLGGGGSLALLLLPLLVGDKANMVRAAMDLYKKKLQDCINAQNSARSRLCLITTPSAAPVLSWTKDTATEATIQIDWSRSLPKPPAGAPPEYFGDFSQFTWQVAYGFADDPAAPPGITILNPTTERSCAVTDPAFLQQRSVYVWVRSRFKLDKEEVASNWSPGGPPITHLLYLPAPKGVVASITNAPAFDQVTIGIAEAKKTRYLVAFAADEEATASPAYQIEVSDGAPMITVPVLGFSLDPGNLKPLKAFIRELSSDATQYRDSPWKASETSLQASQEDLGLTVQQVAGCNALLEWNSTGAAPSAFAYAATRPDGSLIATKTEDQIPGDRIRTQLSSADFTPDVSVILAVRRVPTAPNVLQAFDKKAIRFTSALVISSQSFFDAESQRVELYVTGAAPLTVGMEAAVTMHYAGDNPKPVTIQSKVEFSDSAAPLAKLSAIQLAAPLPQAIDVAIETDQTAEPQRSPQWPFPATSGPFAANFHVHYDGSSLGVYWSITNGSVDSCRMDLVGTNLALIVRGQSLPMTERGDFKAVLTDQHLGVLKNGGKKARIQVWCTAAQQGALKSKEKICWLPDLGLWTGQSKAANTAAAVPLSSLANMSTASANGLGGLWWLDGKCSRIEGVMRTARTDSWKADGGNVYGTPVISGGSAVASCSRGDSHQEIFWIDSAGGIHGLWRTSNGQSLSPPSDYKVQSPGTADTTRGGSLVALCCASNTMDLWYLTPDGNVNNAHWWANRPTGWGAPTRVAQGIVSGDAARPALAACSGGPAGSAELFWVQRVGSGYTVQNRRCRETNATTPAYDAQVVTDAAAASPAPGTKPHALCSSLHGTVVAWITSTGAVQTAVRKAVDGASPLPPWKLAWTVAPPGTASLRSQLCSGTWDAAARLPGLYWIGDDGSVTVAEYNSEQSPDGRLWYDYWASYKHNVNITWRQDPRCLGEIAVRPGTADSVRLFWISGVDNCVYHMRYPKEGAKPWPS